ncbi:MAG: hypothetical protein ACOC0L_00495, partial [bacterium]
MYTRTFLSILAVAGWATAGWLAVQALHSGADDAARDLDLGNSSQSIDEESPAGSPPNKTAPAVAVQSVPEPAKSPGAYSPHPSPQSHDLANTPVDSLQNISGQLRTDLLAALGSAGGNRYEALLDLGLAPSNDDFRAILAEADTDDSRRLHSSLGILRLWAQHDPAAAAEWARSQQNESVLRYSAGTIMRHWAQTDVQAAYAWAATLPVGTARDMAINQCVRQFSETDPRMAAQALERIDKENYRAAAVGNLARN